MPEYPPALLRGNSLIADIPSSLESRPFANPRESTYLPSGRGSRLETDRNSNPAYRHRVADSTLGNKQEGALPRSVAEQ
jgi:hypothetical protein